MKKEFIAYLIVLGLLSLPACTKENTTNENQNTDQFPASGILYKGEIHIYVMNVDGTNPRKLSLSKANYDEDYPSSSPDGKKIVFRRYSKGVIVQDATGEKVIMNDNNSPLFPAWSDNSTIYYSRGNGVTSNGKTYIYSIKADGTGDTQISPVFNDVANPLDYHPSVSPDRSFLLFSTNRTGNVAIKKMNLSDGTNVYLTYSGGVIGESVISQAEYPTWSPNGSKIAFAAYPGYPDFSRPKQIYLMNADGSGKLQITNDIQANCTYPSWSPDGTKIVFQKEYPGFSSSKEIWVMNSDGTGAKALTDRTKTGWEMHPSFIGKSR